MRESAQYLAHLARLARSTGQLRSWIRYATVGFTGAVVNVGVLAFLVERRAWPVGWALVVAILLALLNNFFWNWLFTFRTSQAPSVEPRAGMLSRLLHYGKVCATGVALNASLTVLLNWWGVPLALASAAGVTLGGGWNLFFNVPAIWRSWDSPAPRRHEPVWDDSGNRRLVSTGHTSSGR
jgi:dolichol-phosphate mannosyltransferase